ncbi:MAG: hypothetical protein QOI29_860 [Mycobacterium sp.]|nr:hypothetical protein [Mycobacterium sp.]
MRTLASSLSSSGMEVWVDFEGIPPTADWMREIRGAIEAANVFVFVSSEHSCASEVCRLEVDHARAMRKRIIEVTSSTPDAARVIGTVMNRDPDWVRAHTRLLVRAMAWDSGQRDGSLLLRGAELAGAERDLARQSRDPEATATQAQYVLASRKASSNRQRGLLSIAAVIVVVVALLAVVALAQRARANDRAQIATARGLAAASAAHADDPQLALLLALEAWNSKNTTDAEQALRQAVVRARPSNDDDLVFEVSPKRVGALEFTSDGAALAIGDGDGQVRLLDVENGSTVDIDRLPGHVNDIAFSADDRYLLVVGMGGTRLYDAQQGGLLGEQDAATLSAVSFAPDGRQWVGGGTDGVIWLFDRETGEVVKRWEDLHPPILGMDFAPDGKRFVASGGFGVRMFEPTGDGQPVQFEGPAGVVQNVVFSPSGDRIASGGDDLRIRVWDVASRKVVQTFSDASQVYGLAFAPNGRQLVSVGVDGSPVLWFVGDRPMRVELQAPKDAGTSIAISPDGEKIAVGRFPGTVTVLDCEVCGDIDEVLELARDRVTRALTSQERAQYLS